MLITSLPSRCLTMVQKMHTTTLNSHNHIITEAFFTFLSYLFLNSITRLFKSVPYLLYYYILLRFILKGMGIGKLSCWTE